MRAISALTVSVLLAVPAAARAQAADASVHGAGYKVGEGSVVTPTVGLETEYVSNVFYEDTSPAPSGVLRILGGLAVGSLPPERLDGKSKAGANGADPSMEYRLGLNVVYERYLSSDRSLTAQNNVSGGAEAKLTLAPKGTVRFEVADTLDRYTRPVNFESSSRLDRDVNKLKVSLGWHPRGRTVNAVLRYENYLDRFESEASSFANRLQHTIGLRTTWQYLPVTQLYLDASQGVYTQLGSTLYAGQKFKQDALPLRILLGARTALTDVTTLRLHAGFAAGFYAAGASYMSAAYGAEFGYRYSPLGRLLVEVARDYADSINANYYSTYRARVGFEHQVSRVYIGGRARTELREYAGIPTTLGGGTTRSDVVLGLTADLRYNYREWLAVTLGYDLAVDQTDYRSNVGGISDDPSYVRHELGMTVNAAF